MAQVQHVIVSYAISLAPKLHPFRDFLKETVPWLWSEDINKVFRETKVKLANSLEEGIMSWGKHGVGYLLLQKHCSCPKKPDGSSNTLYCLFGWPVCMVGSRFTHIIWPPC